MNRSFLYALILFAFVSKANAQTPNYIFEQGIPGPNIFFQMDSAFASNIVTDTNSLWQIGKTTKPFFAPTDTIGPTIMTDTASSYYVNANSWFIFPVYLSGFNILSFKHKYQTTAGYDGCIVEFSEDYGANWTNVKGDCNRDTAFNGDIGIYTDNFYDFSDTLQNGQPAFSGTSNGWRTSRLQPFTGIPIKPGKSSSQCNINYILIRFRFESDSVAESLDGWIIDSMAVEFNSPPWSLQVAANSPLPLQVHPNPSHDGIITFPALQGEHTFSMEIINSFSQIIYKNSYKREIDLSDYPNGLYFYKVTNGSDSYSGKILLE